jgi:hypothetical protein
MCWLVVVMCNLHGSAAVAPHVANHQNVPLQVYLAIAALLANGGQLKSGAALAEAAVDSISSEATKAMKQIRKSVTNPLAMLRGGEKKPAAEAAPLYVGPRCALRLAVHLCSKGHVSSHTAALCPMHVLLSARTCAICSQSSTGRGEWMHAVQWPLEARC